MQPRVIPDIVGTPRAKQNINKKKRQVDGGENKSAAGVVFQDASPRVSAVLGYWSQECRRWRLQPRPPRAFYSAALKPTRCLSLHTGNTFYCCDKKQQRSKNPSDVINHTSQTS